MQCIDALGGEGAVAYTNPSRDFVEPLPSQKTNRLKSPWQREYARPYIKRSDSHSNAPLSSSIITIDEKFDPREQGQTHIQPP